MQSVTRIIRSIVGLLVVLAFGSVGLFLYTSGDNQVPATVTGDASLPSVEIDGVRLHAEAAGNVDAPVVIVLHGGPGGDYRSLKALDALAGNYRVVFYDQRGAGLSERVAEDRLTLDGYLAELDGVIDAYSPDAPVRLVGHSWGAMLATAYLGVAPEKVAAAVLMEPGFFNAEEFAAWQERADDYMSGPGMMWQMVLAIFSSMHVEGPDDKAANDLLFARMVHGFTNHPDNPYHCPGEPFDAPSWRFGSTASQLASATKPAELDRIALGTKTFDGPVLLLAGACDDWIGAELQARHRDMFADAALTIIPNAGHDMVWDNPEATLAAIRRFLAGVD